jgi:hypothetical protein
VVAVDILLRLTKAQLKTWLYYKRREGVDRKAWGKARSIGEATGLVAGTIKNARSWLVKHGWLKRNGYSASGLPMFLAVIGKLPQASFEDDGGNSEMTEGSFENDGRGNSEMTGASFSSDTEVPTQSTYPESTNHEAPTHKTKVSKSVSQTAPASPSLCDDGSEVPFFFSKKVGRLLTKEEQKVACELYYEFFPNPDAEWEKVVELWEATHKINPSYLRGLWLWNKTHKSGNLRFHTVTQFCESLASTAENSASVQYQTHNHRDCPVCLKAKWKTACSHCGLPVDNVEYNEDFAPLRGLELQLEAEHVAVELHGAVHVANKLNNVGEFHFGSPLADSTTAKILKCNGVASAPAKSCLPIRHSDSYAESCSGRATPQK